MVYVPVLNLEDRISDGHSLADRITVRQLTSHHALDDAVLRKIIHALGQRLNGVSVTNNGDGIRHITDLIELVGNDDHGHALLFQLQHDLQKLCGLLVVQSRRRLIQNEKLHILRHGLGNLDELLLAYAQRVHGHIDVLALQSDLRQHLCRLRPGLRPVNDALAGTLFVPQEHILRHRHVRA